MLKFSEHDMRPGWKIGYSSCVPTALLGKFSCPMQNHQIQMKRNRNGKKRCETIGFCLPHRKFRCLWAICMYEHKLHKQPSKIISGTSTNTQSPRISFGKSVKTLLTASKISFFDEWLNGVWILIFLHLKLQVVKSFVWQNENRM